MKRRFFLFGSLAAMMTAVACKKGSTGPTTPPTPAPKKYSNQINDYDGMAYTTLTAAQTALNGLEPTIFGIYTQFKPQFNQAVAAYDTAIDTYKAYRAAPNSAAQLTSLINILTTDIANLELAFQTKMGTVQKANELRPKFKSRVNWDTVFMELELAASVAAAYPVTALYGTLAEVIISVAKQAYDNYVAQNAIDVTTLKPITQIP